MGKLSLESSEIIDNFVDAKTETDSPRKMPWWVKIILIVLVWWVLIMWWAIVFFAIKAKMNDSWEDEES